ncbi:unnamed protein product [Cyclocybe aegerita]|uniref:HMG box domain-containing protein n=1 Tax=Cyclocybe aegerita TaxID=1973307 RepID=A0A8S0W825_CYCAE|nr:unnamed protein product [Cyclocybe aegerita]
MEVHSRVFGWSPPNNEDYLDVQIAQNALLPFQNPTFHISEPTIIIKRVREAPSANFGSTSPASSTSALSTDGDSAAEKRVETAGRNGDPNWVARPRNEFILFRCDYVRKHSREGKRIRRPPGAEAEKTLSKQAAEAWHHLSPEKRLYWKEQANSERNEHARRHPDYRYRPKKSTAGRKRQTRASPTKSSPAADEVPLPDPSPISRTTSGSSLPPPRLAPRRSSSVPQLIVTDPATRRLRSTVSHGWIGVATPASAPPDCVSFGPPSRDYTPIPTGFHSAPAFISSGYASPNFSSTPTPQAPPEQTMHPASSSLLNWNGERLVPAAPQPTYYLSSTPNHLPPPSHFDGNGNIVVTEYTSGGNPLPSSQLFAVPPGAHYQQNGDVWMPATYPSEDSMLSAPQEGDTSGGVLDPQLMHGMAAASGPVVGGTAAIAQPGFNDIVAPRAQMPSMGVFGVDLARKASAQMDVLGSGAPESNTETLFNMDTDDFFNPRF